jgi:acylphosphatase
VLHVVIHGRVQRVGFRWFVRERARALRLTGWVRNRIDGSVEVLAAGREEGLLQLRSALHRGPEGAVVSRIEELEGEPEIAALTPFGILR